MKKTIFILITIFCSLNSFGQLKGEYVRSDEFCGQYINFLDSNKFIFIEWCDLGPIDSGGGNYQINERELTLSFLKYIPSYPRFIIDSNESTKDSVTISVQVFDYKTNDELGYAAVFLEYNDSSFKEGKSADTSGRAVFIRPKSNSKLTTYATFLNRGKEPISIFANRNYNLKMYLYFQNPIIIRDEKMVFKIRKRKKDSFELKDSYKGAKFEKYTKTN